jgi:hypothetical protein
MFDIFSRGIYGRHVNYKEIICFKMPDKITQIVCTFLSLLFCGQLEFALCWELATVLLYRH